MKKAMHAKPFRLHAPGHKARHARPESPRTRVVRAVSLCLACICLLVTATVYPASAATGSSSMSSLQNKLDKLSQSIVQHKKELSNAKKKEQAAKALEEADAFDAYVKEHHALCGPLHGIPVMLKDNFNTTDMPTTAGKIMMNAWPGIGVDDWLKPFNGNTPLTARYQWVTYNQQ